MRIVPFVAATFVFTPLFTVSVVVVFVPFVVRVVAAFSFVPAAFASSVIAFSLVIVVSLPVVVPVVGVHFVARLFLGDPLVGLRDLLDLLGQLESDVLESGWLGAVHDERLRWTVPRSGQVVVEHHFGDDRGHLFGVELEVLGKPLFGDVGVELAVGEEISPQTFLLDLLPEHLNDLFALWKPTPNKLAQLVINSVPDALPPITQLHELTGSHQMVSHVLWRGVQVVPLGHPQNVVKLFTDHSAFTVELVLSQVWNLVQHGRN